MITVSAGLNLFILGAVILNSYRTGKIEGSLKNGGYAKCPFYKRRVDNAVEKARISK